jgi:zinc finger protein DZIP1
MESLRSTVLTGDIEKIEDQPSLGGMYGSNGFFFQQRRGQLNLRSLASINIEKLIREVDVDLLQIHIENITFCNIREEDLRYLTDPQIVKFFRISQLMLEYLLYSQDKLVENLNNLSQKYTAKKR